MKGIQRTLAAGLVVTLAALGSARSAGPAPDAREADALDRDPEAGPPLAVVDEPGLRRSVETLYTALQTEDWKSVHGFMTLFLDETDTVEQFVKDMSEMSEEGQDRPKAWAILRVGPTDSGPLDPTDPDLVDHKIDSAAAVVMDVTYLEPDGTSYRTTDQEDLWIRMDGRWLLMWQTIHASGSP